MDIKWKAESSYPFISKSVFHRLNVYVSLLVFDLSTLDIICYFSTIKGEYLVYSCYLLLVLIILLILGFNNPIITLICIGYWLTLNIILKSLLPVPSDYEVFLFTFHVSKMLLTSLSKLPFLLPIFKISTSVLLQCQDLWYFYFSRTKYE